MQPDSDLDLEVTEAITWSHGLLEETDEVLGGLSLAIDHRDRLHVSFIGGSSRHLFYGSGAGSEWMVEDTERGARCCTPGGTAIGVDSQASPTIAVNAGGIRVVQQVEGEWSWETAYSWVGNNDFYGSIAHVGDSPRVVYRLANLGVLSPMADGSASDGWEQELIDGHSLIGYHNSVATDAAGNLHVSYSEVPTPHVEANGAINYGDNALHYATNTTGEWTTEAIDDTDRPEGGTALGVSRSDQASEAVVILYYASDAEKLRYVSGRSGEWSEPEVVASTGTGRNPNLAISSDGAVHAVFETVSGGLGYAHNRGGAWQVVELPDTLGSQPEIQLDSTGEVHIVYLGRESTSVRYASSRTF